MSIVLPSVLNMTNQKAENYIADINLREHYKLIPKQKKMSIVLPSVLNITNQKAENYIAYINWRGIKDAVNQNNNVGGIVSGKEEIYSDHRALEEMFPGKKKFIMTKRQQERASVLQMVFHI
ncbi:Hypothetical predicted protein [Mytilus galloprovincialis]|uniref:Uncharacterized protein n=1 Tax=Mytilus galloprovincialis TaxID=29158 RepID=A0A8B6E4X1_MYTGA|nr:Hypothetical predicted protein [Mytilus galloprovincialis]